MNCLTVSLGKWSYDVLIDDGLVSRSADLLAPFARDGRLVVVSDDRVWAAHGDRLCNGLAPLSIDPIIVPAGEGSKSWRELVRLVDALLARNISRRDHIVAFGGGVIGDLAGFAAAIVKRGCGLIQIPTTLLAQVDSSVGGKAGINAAAGKNMVGAFHQPSMVLIDPGLLETLDRRHLRAGYAEIVKYALIEDPELFEWLEANGHLVLDRDPVALTYAIRVAVDGKRQIVEEDEREESGRRALLNLGHTFGHALEAEAGFGDTVLHGEAVAVGLVQAFRFSEALGLCASIDADRLEGHLRAVGLPTRFPADPRRLVAHMQHDKKADGENLAFVLARGIGQAFVQTAVPAESVEGFLAEQM